MNGKNDIEIGKISAYLQICHFSVYRVDRRVFLELFCSKRYLKNKNRRRCYEDIKLWSSLQRRFLRRAECNEFPPLVFAQ